MKTTHLAARVAERHVGYSHAPSWLTVNPTHAWIISLQTNGLFHFSHGRSLQEHPVRQGRAHIPSTIKVGALLCEVPWGVLHTVRADEVVNTLQEDTLTVTLKGEVLPLFFED